MVLESIGFLLAYFEIYFPDRAAAVEKSLDRFWRKPVNWRLEAKPDHINLSETIQRVAIVVVPILMFAGYKPFVAEGFCENPPLDRVSEFCDMLSIGNFGAFITLLIFFVMFYTTYFFGAIATFLSLRLLARTIWLIDHIGRGKGIGGFGLILAAIGLFEAST